LETAKRASFKTGSNSCSSTSINSNNHDSRDQDTLIKSIAAAVAASTSSIVAQLAIQAPTSCSSVGGNRPSSEGVREFEDQTALYYRERVQRFESRHKNCTLVLPDFFVNPPDELSTRVSSYWNTYRSREFDPMNEVVRIITALRSSLQKMSCCTDIFAQGRCNCKHEVSFTLYVVPLLCSVA
jgi:hypothetical protein